MSDDKTSETRIPSRQTERRRSRPTESPNDETRKSDDETTFRFRDWASI